MLSSDALCHDLTSRHQSSRLIVSFHSELCSQYRNLCFLLDTSAFCSCSSFFYSNIHTCRCKFQELLIHYLQNGHKKSAPSSLMHSLSSRRQTGYNTIHKERVRLYRRIPNPSRSCLTNKFCRLFESEPHQNLRYLILNPQCPAKQFFTSSFRHYNMDNNRYAFAKVQKVFGITNGKGEKFGLGQEKSPNTLLYQGWMRVLLYVLFLLPPCGSR